MQNICKIILSIIGAIFIIKYGMRVLPMSIVLSLSIIYIVALYMYIGFICKRVENINPLYNNIISIVLMSIIIGFIIFVSIFIDIYSLNVDRWSAITYTLNELLKGNYPYNVVTHLGNHCSTMPAWMIFHLPFYLLGNVGFSLIFGLIVFIFTIWKNLGIKSVAKTLLILVFCPSFWYEIITVSDLQTNFFLISAFICYVLSYEEIKSFQLYIFAFIAGLFLSTRLTVCFPLFFCFMPLWWKQDILKKIMLSIICIATYMTTLLPFIFWNGETTNFVESNPFYVQNIQFELSAIIVIIILSFILLWWSWKDKYKVYASSAITLFIFIASVFLSQYIGSDFNESLLSFRYDYTYLAQSIPFAIMAICIHK